jgi:penicillin-binding protein 1B
MAKKTKRKAGKSRPRWILGAVVAAAVALALLALWVAWPFWHLAGQFADRPLQQPSRLYGAPVTLELGDPVAAGTLRRQLESQGYASSGSQNPAPRQFRASQDTLWVHTPRTPTAAGWRPDGIAAIRFAGGEVAELTWEERPVERLELEAPLVTSYYGPDRRERRPVRLEDLPEYLTHAVLAAEDARFFRHGGVSVRGMLRAAWVNLRAGGVRQGGSTLTQQLVKNLFLTHQRTLSRKVREMALALLVDWRYSKPAILNAYLNEIYWGEWQGINLMGVGAAADAYFGKDASRLSLCESALLAGMIQSPGTYDPGRHAERARQRRDWVLGRMHELEWLDDASLAKATNEPLCYDERAAPRVEAHYFRDAARDETARRFGLSELADRGYTVLTTVRVEDQATAEEAVAWGLEALESGWEDGRVTDGPLQAALISIDPRSGAVTAYVGGRDYGASQFDRARLAKRQAGSAFKPVVYAAAFEEGVTLPSGLLEDEPLRVEVAGSGVWEPQNDDREFHGQVTAREALEHSRNVPTARLALETGLDVVADTASRLGLDRRLPRVPSMALGALEVTPLELATIYATLADGGVRHATHFVDAVLGPDGEVVAGRPLPQPTVAVSPETAYLVTSVLEGVLDRGTARVVRSWGMEDRLAGKTGTTNDRRDSWFAGYSPDRCTLVWVGYDDNATTRLSGARAGLPIWNRFIWRMRPPGGYRPAQPPPGITTATVDPLSGELATSRCPEITTEYFPRDAVPTRVCYLHASPWELRAQEAREQGVEGQRFRRWLRRVFKRRQPDDDPPDR